MAIADQIAAEAQRQGVNPALAIEVASAESGLNPNIPDSKAGAIGVFQLEPVTAASLGVNPRDVAQNISGGVRYLRAMLLQFGGSVPTALAAYNAGPTVVSDFLRGTNASGRNPGLATTPNGIPPYPETQSYVAKILAGIAQYQPTITPQSVASGAVNAAQQLFAAAPQSADEVDPRLKWALLAAAGLGVYWLMAEVLDE